MTDNHKVAIPLELSSIQNLPIKNSLYRGTSSCFNIDAIINNGKIQFTYKEAEKKYDIPKSTFQRALNKLKFYGFIKVNIPGGDHCPTKYYIVDDYKKCLDRDYHLGKPIKSGTLIGKKTQFRKHRQK